MKPGRKPKDPAWRDAEIRAAWESGEHPSAIAKQLRMSPTRVYERARAMNLAPLGTRAYRVRRSFPLLPDFGAQP